MTRVANGDSPGVFASMISLILYGRNDNHGYNLHKRAAVSLNAMAEVLTDADDEILFVDYNTPDDLPTFVEAIADTLTPLARERLRILRVRPALHERYRSLTHLLALESVSRNIALRRSNPNNRWVLSTNTDMIFVPHEEGGSLSEIVRPLAAGFYQLPRFELPESLWESFDRRDGAGIIANTRSLATRFHLNEVVYGSDDVLFDGPGDFQLCLRDDLIRIHGFHEGMLRGWHVDANLCVRMIALRGKIKSLASGLYAYHCDHTRQVTSAHGHDRVENDAASFLNANNDPRIVEQAETWGMPDEPIEEIRLGRNDVFARYLKGLGAAIQSPQTESYESAYRSDSFGETRYRRAHVLPFVLDLLAAYPAGTKVLFAGARADMARDIAVACAATGGGMEIIAPAEFSWLDGLEGVVRTPLEEALKTADVLVFEFGAGELGVESDAEAATRLAAARRALIAASAAETTRVGQGKPRRRVLAINAIHNEFESLISGLMSYTLTPFSSHIRHGYMLVEEVAGAPASGFDVRTLWRDVQQSLGRTRSIPLWESQELASMARDLAAAPVGASIPSEALVSAEALIALLRHRQVEQACDVPSGTARALADRLDLERPGAAVRRLLSPKMVATARSPETSAMSRVADIADWEKPSFAGFVDRHFGGPRAYGAPDRNPWTWERAAILDVLADAGLLRTDARVLLVSTVPDQFAGVFSDYVAALEIARARRGDGTLIQAIGTDGSDPHGFDKNAVHWQPSPDGAGAFDAVIFLQQSLMRRGPNGVQRALEEAARLTKPGGVVLASAMLALVGERGIHEFEAAPLVDGSFAQALADTLAPLQFCGPLEATPTRENCDRVIDHVREDLRYRRMVTLRGRSVSAEGLLTFRHTGADGGFSLNALSKVIAVGAASDLRFQFWRGVRFAQRVERRLRWELDRLRGPRRRR